MRKFSLFFVAAAFLLTCSIPTWAGAGEPLAVRAVSENSAEAAAAVPELRKLGPAGLDALFTQYAAEIQSHLAGNPDINSARWERIAAALDAVGQQRNSYSAHLYWYTDLEQAKAAARATNRPILSLRLLGDLTDEFSCANSRFFRTVLYANPAVAEYLRANYILHWRSERAAPRIVIDYGDGRKLERTITGNSIHYILDQAGHPVDALPGLYGPGAFLPELVRAAALVRSLNGKNADQRFAQLNEYHRMRMRETSAAWEADLAAIGAKPRAEGSAIPLARPGAVDAAPVAVTKAVVEFDMLKSITADTRRLESLTDLTAWNRIASRHLGNASLDQNSQRLMQRELFPNRTGELTGAERDTLDAAVRKFQANIALDTVRNEYTLRSQMHAWYVADGGYVDLETLNERVYSKLFLTPKADPWLGLYNPEVYTGLENGGVTKP